MPQITGDYLPSDAQANALIRLYLLAVAQLEAALGAAISNLALGNVHYRYTRLTLVEALLARLGVEAPPAAARAVTSAYRLGLNIGETAEEAPRPPIGASFGGVVHERAVGALARSLISSLDQAHEVVGRRFRDVYHSVGVRQVAAGQIAGTGHREMTKAIREDLLHEGVTSFVDRAGRRWKLDTYAAMVARTTSREAVTAGVTNRLLDRGVDLVTVSSHPHPTDICTPYDGRTYSLTGATPGFPVLGKRRGERPPFHPNCRHVLTPAAANFEAIERLLGLRAVAA